MSATPLPQGYTQSARSIEDIVAIIKSAFGAGSTVIPINALSTGTFTFVNESVSTGLTAVGTNRATSLALTSAINYLSAVGSGTGVTLPSAASVGIGGSVIIFNADGTNAATVYGAGSDTIDTVAAATGVTLTHAKRCQYFVTAAATWVSAQLGVVSA